MNAIMTYLSGHNSVQFNLFQLHSKFFINPHREINLIKGAPGLYLVLKLSKYNLRCTTYYDS